MNHSITDSTKPVRLLPVRFFYSRAEIRCQPAKEAVWWDRQGLLLLPVIGAGAVLAFEMLGEQLGFDRFQLGLQLQ